MMMHTRDINYTEAGHEVCLLLTVTVSGRLCARYPGIYSTLLSWFGVSSKHARTLQR